MRNGAADDNVDFPVPGYQDELPPAYTPAPDFNQGEETLELGPRRPFQQPHLPRQSAPTPTNLASMPTAQGNNSFLLSPNPTGGSTRSASVNTVNTRSSTPASTTPSTNSSQTPSIPSTANSDFARDFYAAGTGQGGLSAGASGDVRSRSSEGLGTSVTPNEPSGSNGPNGGTDDDRPTTRPVPGHALLKDGKVLVYPKGFTCPICFNIGYKRSDPEHPCKKCWKKYAKPYSPVMSYAPDAGSTTTLQRPLPKPASPSSLSVPGGGTAPNLPARPNTLRRPSGPTHSLHRATPSVPNLHAASSTAYGSNTMPGSYPSPVTATPTGCTHPFHSMGPTGLYSPSYIQPQQTGGGGASAVVYSAGDPRLGGRLCWQCGGAGRVSYLFFDNSVCMECSGIGRVFR
ncbi:hypothetical protein JOM56_008022 [Amanita muscaria]